MSGIKEEPRAAVHLLRPGELVSAPETAGGRVGGSVSKSVCMAGFSKIAGNSDKSAAWCALPPDVHSQATGCSELPSSQTIDFWERVKAKVASLFNL